VTEASSHPVLQTLPATSELLRRYSVVSATLVSYEADLKDTWMKQKVAFIVSLSCVTVWVIHELLLVCQGIYWLSNWLTGRVANWLSNWLTDSLTDYLMSSIVLGNVTVGQLHKTIFVFCETWNFQKITPVPSLQLLCFAKIYFNVCIVSCHSTSEHRASRRNILI
jgi:hypothetical protein